MRNNAFAEYEILRKVFRQNRNERWLNIFNSTSDHQLRMISLLNCNSAVPIITTDL